MWVHILSSKHTLILIYIYVYDGMDSPIEITFFIQIESVWKDERSKELVYKKKKIKRASIDYTEAIQGE